MSSSTAEPGSFSPQENIVTILQAQHDQIRALLVQLEEGPDAATFQWLVRLLAVHETAEEVAVYPDLAHHVDGSAAVVDARRAEEREGKAALARLEKVEIDSDEFRKGLAELHEAIEHHAAAEEAELFPLLRDGLESRRRRQMAESFRLVEAVAPTHPHPHNPDGQITGMLVGTVSSISDRVRDALRDRS